MLSGKELINSKPGVRGELQKCQNTSRKKKKKQSLVLSGHLHSRADLGQQGSVATIVMCQPTLTAE